MDEDLGLLDQVPYVLGMRDPSLLLIGDRRYMVIRTNLTIPHVPVIIFPFHQLLYYGITETHRATCKPETASHGRGLIAIISRFRITVNILTC